ncbi:MAG: purine-nucleoside phosphorylase [Propionibacteriaceae bacterium]|nr:purine-nucleoside phosphorylase [Propionibacteriaceae bacterium]MDX6323318.1 purine-nucleoside phosphorylase [Propionibacteriaceae bacterium]
MSAERAGEEKPSPIVPIVLSLPTSDALTLAAEAGAALKSRFEIDQIDVAFVLGSGWSAAAEDLGEPIGQCLLSELPGFSQPVVAGHGGALRVVRTPAGKTAAVFTGRTHYYEERGVDAVVHGVRTAAAAGASVLVLTNGCGGLQLNWRPGTPVLISDHINLTGASPLHGPTFIDLTDLYSSRLRALAHTVDPTLPEGVYVQFRGPQYETPAEVRMAGILGGDLVGMSTALEAIAAREAGLEVLGISLVTNLAAGISPTPLHHSEVIEAGQQAAPTLRALLTGLAGVL